MKVRMRTKRRKKKKKSAEENKQRRTSTHERPNSSRSLHVVWDDFFGNKNKCVHQNRHCFMSILIFTAGQLTPETTVFRPLPGMRCCDNCEPRLFEVERITIDKTSTLKRGKKRKLLPGFDDAIRKDLSQWRENDLLDRFYGGTSIIA